MSKPGGPERLFAVTTPGLEGVLLDEVVALGLTGTQVKGGVEVSGPPGAHQRLNLWLRTATRVLLRVGAFEAPDWPALERGLRGLGLGAYLPSGAQVSIRASARRSRLSHPGRIEALARSTLRLAEATSPEAPELLVRLDQDACTLSLDTSGAPLYRRGYRQELSRAPLRETLAAGMLLLAGYDAKEALWDPMCGSGTVAIEAALLALGRAPGVERGFAFERWPSHDRARFDALRAGAKARAELSAQVVGSDLNAGALGTARRNARRAGLEGRVRLERHDVRTTQPLTTLPPTGLLVCNPPYGKRVGEAKELEPLYRALGLMVRDALPGWRAAILVPDPRLERALGLGVRARHRLDNGGLACELLVVDRG
jgi:putative N6-adenine-specific DNA methylase